MMDWKKKRARNKASAYTQRKEIRKTILERDGYQCLKCGSTENLTLDHIVSVYSGGENSINNLQTLCNKCNAGKPPESKKDYRRGGD